MGHTTRAVALLLMSLSAPRALAQTIAPPPALSLADAVGEALANNERIVNQSDAIAQADLGLRLARNAFRPKVTPNIFGSIGRDDISSQTYRVDVSQKLVTGTELRLSTGTVSSLIPGQLGDASSDVLFYSADTTVTLSQPLLRGFGKNVARRGLNAAELRREDAARQQSLSEQQVAVDVAAAYYRVVSQQAFVDVARQSLTRARRLRDASEAKLDAGLVSQLDVLRSQQLVSQAEMQLFDSQSAVEDARDQLTFLMGRDRTEPFTVEAAIPRPPADPIDVPSATALALRHRLDLKSRVASADDAENQIRFSRNQLLPQVDVNFAFTRRETAASFRDSFGLDGYRFATFFTIAMPVDRTAQQVEYQSAVIDRQRRRREAENARAPDRRSREAGHPRTGPLCSQRGGGGEQRRLEPPRGRSRAAALRERALEQSRRGDGGSRPAAGGEPPHPGAGRCRGRRPAAACSARHIQPAHRPVGLDC